MIGCNVKSFHEEGNIGEMNTPAAAEDDAYEELTTPDKVIRPEAMSLEESDGLTNAVEMLVNPAVEQSESYDADDEEIIRRRLEGLGYL